MKEAARRETFEETGVKADVLTSLGSIDYKKSRKRIHCFAGPAATKEAIEQIRVKLGLDQPLVVQFGRYVQDLGKGDLGNSLTTGQPVATEIRNRLPASAQRHF